MLNKKENQQWLGKRKITVVANWKMNLNYDEEVKLASEIKESLLSLSTVEIVLCPSFLSIPKIKEIFSKTAVKIGAQDVFYENCGAFTGGISVKMLEPFCDYVIIGHSERRRYFKETDEEVNKKVKAALQSKIMPIICVGEDLEAWRRGDIDTVIDQVRKAVKGIDQDQITKILIAYEPVWAIGSGNPATAEYANKICLQIRQLLESFYSRDLAMKIRILYGGSVNIENASEFIAQSEIDGLLVGGLSLKAKEFILLVKNINKIK